MAEQIEERPVSRWEMPRDRGPNAGWWYSPLAAGAAVVVGAIGGALAREPAGLINNGCVPSPHESQGTLLINLAMYLLAPLTVILGGRAILRGPAACRIAGAVAIVAVLAPLVVLVANFGDFYCSN